MLSDDWSKATYTLTKGLAVSVPVLLALKGLVAYPLNTYFLNPEISQHLSVQGTKDTSYHISAPDMLTQRDARGQHGLNFKEFMIYTTSSSRNFGEVSHRIPKKSYFQGNQALYDLACQAAEKATQYDEGQLSTLNRVWLRYSILARPMARQKDMNQWGESFSARYCPAPLPA